MSGTAAGLGGLMGACGSTGGLPKVQFGVAGLTSCGFRLAVLAGSTWKIQFWAGLGSSSFWVGCGGSTSNIQKGSRRKDLVVEFLSMDTNWN